MEGAAPAEGGLWLFGGYAQTKAGAEFALARAGKDLRWQIIRGGLLVPECGAPFPSGHFATAFAAALGDAGVLPEEAEEAAVDLTPVGGAAEAALRIAENGGPGVFHWANIQGACLSDVIDAIGRERSRRGIPPLPTVSTAKWEDRIAALPGIRRALLRSAFRKSDFVTREAARGPFLNADLFQATGRKFACRRALRAGCAAPPTASAQMSALAVSALS